MVAVAGGGGGGGGGAHEKHMLTDVPVWCWCICVCVIDFGGGLVVEWWHAPGVHNVKTTRIIAQGSQSSKESPQEAHIIRDLDSAWYLPTEASKHIMTYALDCMGCPPAPETMENQG